MSSSAINVPAVNNNAVNYMQQVYDTVAKNNAWSAKQAADLNAWQRETNRIAMDFNAAEAAKNRDWQKMMSDTAHQREVADLKAAGLNPVLSASGGNGAAVTSGATASGVTSSGAKGDTDTSATSALVGLLGTMINSQTELAKAATSANTNLAVTNANNENNMLVAQLNYNLQMKLQQNEHNFKFQYQGNEFNYQTLLNEQTITNQHWRDEYLHEFSKEILGMENEYQNERFYDQLKQAYELTIKELNTQIKLKNVDIDMFNKEFALKVAKFNESIYEYDSSYFIRLIDSIIPF